MNILRNIAFTLLISGMLLGCGDSGTTIEKKSASISFDDFVTMIKFADGRGLEPAHRKSFYYSTAKSDDLLVFEPLKFYEENRKNTEKLQGKIKYFTEKHLFVVSDSFYTDDINNMGSVAGDVFFSQNLRDTFNSFEKLKVKWDLKNINNQEAEALAFGYNLSGDYVLAENIRKEACKRFDDFRCDPFKEINILLKVLDTNNAPVEDVEILFLNENRPIRPRYNPSGIYSFSVKSFEEQKLRFRIIKDGYAGELVGFSVRFHPNGHEFSADVILKESQGVVLMSQRLKQSKDITPKTKEVLQENSDTSGSFFKDLQGNVLGGENAEESLLEDKSDEVDEEAEQSLFSASGPNGSKIEIVENDDDLEVRLGNTTFVIPYGVFETVDGLPYNGEVIISVNNYDANTPGIDNLLGADTIFPEDEIGPAASVQMETFGMPYVEFFNPKTNEPILVPSTSPLLIKSVVVGFSKLKKSLTKDNLDTLLQLSETNNGIRQYDLMAAGIDYPAWWVMDLKKGVWVNEPMKLLDDKGSMEGIYYSYKK